MQLFFWKNKEFKNDENFEKNENLTNILHNSY